MDNIKEKLESLVKDLKEKGQESYPTDVSKNTNEAIKKKGLKKIIVALNTSGCSYRKRGVGCFHCGHIKGYEHPEEMFYRFKEDVDRFEQRDKVFIYSNGSFLDETEISIELQKKILQYLKRKNFKKIVIESRPEFVNNLDHLLELVSPDNLVVCLGFDTYNDKVRSLCLNKGFSREDYNKATEVLRSRNVSFETRVVVKPPFLTESEGIDEAIKSANYAFDRGSDSISLEPIALQKHTLQDYLYQRGLYRVSWLWSIISIINSIHKNGTILFGGETFYPMPYETAQNCKKCTPKVKQALYVFNKKQDIKLLNGLNCDCKILWQNQLNVEKPDLYRRILEVVK